MRTTVTLDHDVERMLRTVIKQKGITFKEALNEALRSGLSKGRSPAKANFSQRTFSLGPEEYFRWDKALATADAIEDEEVARKLSLSK